MSKARELMRDHRYDQHWYAEPSGDQYVSHAGMQAQEYYDLSYDPYSYNSADWHGFSLAEILSYYRSLYERSIFQVAEELRIRAAYLQALEEGSYHSLPGVTYASGFVRTYATYLGLPADEMVERFKFEARGKFEQQQPLKPNPITAAIAQQSQAQASSKAPQGIALVACLLMIMGGFGTWWLMSSSGPNITMQPNGTAVLIDPQSGERRALPAVGSSVNDRSLPFVQADSNFEADSPTELLAVLQSIDNDTRFDVDSTPLDAASQDSLDGLGIVSAAPAATADVLIKAKRLTWVQVRDLRGNTIASEVLQEGQEFQVPQQPNLQLISAEREFLDIYVDGALVPNLRALDSSGRAFSLDPRDLKEDVLS